MRILLGTLLRIGKEKIPPSAAMVMHTAKSEAARAAFDKRLNTSLNISGDESVITSVSKKIQEIQASLSGDLTKSESLGKAATLVTDMVLDHPEQVFGEHYSLAA